MIRRHRFLKMTSAMMAVILGCADPTEVTADLSLPEPAELTLSIGDTEQLDGGLMVTLEGVSEDSRCPSDVECVWEGRIAADLRLAIFDEAGDEVRVDSSGEGAADWRDLRVTLVEATPDPVSTGAIDPEDYRITVRLEER